jgi:hypothetical protein
MSENSRPEQLLEKAILNGANELRAIVEDLVTLEEGLEATIGNLQTPTSPSDLLFLQDLDFIVQKLQALEGYFSRLSSSDDLDAQRKIDDAIEKILIGDLRLRLSGAAEEATKRSEPDIFL